MLIADEPTAKAAAADPRAERRGLRGFVLARCRLCWRITAAVFFSILLIEAVILIPSYRNYERDRIGEFVLAAAAAVEAGFRVAGSPAPGDAAARTVADALIGIAGLRSILVVGEDGAAVLEAGAPLPVATRQALLSGRVAAVRDGRAAVAVLRPLSTGAPRQVILDIATPQLADALRAFVLRIAGLVALIAAVVTAATMLVLRATVLAPLVDLEFAVASAAGDPHQAERFRRPVDRRDELGSLIGNVNRLLQSVSSTLAVVCQRERELAELNATLEDRVRERTRELETAKVAAEAASQAKSAFLANMSHELRTPLNAINGFAQIMDDGLFGPIGEPRYRGYVGDILDSGRHLLGVIDDVLDISRIEAGEMRLSESGVDLAALVREALCLTHIKAETRNIDLVDGSGDTPRPVFGDARLLRQAVLNLLANAINFTPAGGRVEIDVVAAPDGAVGVRVADTGVGIAEADLPTVLQPFGQVADVMARGHQGTGLGLPLTLHFLELHGGRLDIDSTVGVGTTVTAWLPAARRLADAAAAAYAQVSAAASR